MIRDYLYDRIPLILLFYGNSFLIILVAVLTIYFADTDSVATNMIYLLVLTTFFLLIGLVIDFMRRRALLKRIAKMKNQPYISDEARKLSVTPAPNNETAHLLTLIQRAEDHFEQQIETYDAERRQHDVFINQWVHHMKTPMSVISLLTQEGKNQFNDASVKELLNDIHDENDRFRHGLELMLHLARLDHFSLDLHAEQVDLHLIVRDVINEEKRQFIRKKLYPEVTIVADEPTVYSDSKWLRVILHQLLLNALRYSHANEGNKIHFHVSRAGENTTLFVQDHGIGIPAHDTPRIFEPFYTGDNGRKNSESTGMGLYLARTIASKLGHSLTAESTEGEGTTMRLEFQTKTLQVCKIRCKKNRWEAVCSSPILHI
ncbi:LOW QUALITY PROTEIN: two-component sensor kinase YvcQ [Geomicrobium sp. JCM 19037]|nr:LOW QUALITY PROTEIN: two-component sensor kinase YvcQ [Geomicrobium sp. JCM 19037]